MRKLEGVSIERSMLNRKDAKLHRCSQCEVSRPNRRHYVRRRETDEDDQRMPAPFERGHCIVLDSHEYPSEPDLLGNIIRNNLTDVASGDVWSYAAKSHFGFEGILQRFKKEVVDGPGGFTWIHFHSDSAKVILSAAAQELLREWRVVQTSSPRDQVEMNAVAEETNLELGELTRVLLRTSGLPKTFWGFAYDAGIVVRQMLPRKTARGWTSPYQFCTGYEPDLSHIRVWGSKAYRNLPRDEKSMIGKLSDRASIGHLVGYSNLPIGWIIWDVEKLSTFVTTDVLFDEDIPPRNTEYFADIDRVFAPKQETRVDIADYRWLKGTTHQDDETGLLMRTVAVEIRTFKHQPYVVGRRAVELPNGLVGPVEKDFIFVGDLVRMTEATPGFVPMKGHPAFDGVSLETRPPGLISHGGSESQLVEPVNFGMEAKGASPDVVKSGPSR